MININCCSKNLYDFFQFPKSLYSDNINYRNNDALTHYIIENKFSFYKHSKIIPCLIKKNNYIVGRLCFINDKNMKDYVQVAFFEAIPRIKDLKNIIKYKAKHLFPKCNKIVFGLNGHINYGLGYLCNNYDKPPLFGLTYTNNYQDYFRGCKTNYCYTYKNSNYFLRLLFKLKKNNDISIVKFSKKNLKKDIALYTDLNNKCFVKHPFWSKRTEEEDYELFNLFKVFLNEENLLFVKYKGKIVGFVLWYPDFNQLLLNNKEDLSVKHYLKFKLSNNIDTIRIAEIAILPEYRGKGIMQQLLCSLPLYVSKQYKFTECGFIFENNKASLGITKKLFSLASSLVFKPYRKYVVYEDKL